MKRGFELLKTRSIKGDFIIESLEQKFKLNFPPIFKIFAKYFELGQFHTEKYFVKKYEDYYYLTGYIYEPNNNVDCTGFFQIEKIFEYKARLEGYNDEDVDKELIRIAEIGIGGGIFVGTKGDEIDKIIMSVWDKEPQYEILATNIFEFVLELKEIGIPEEELIEATYSQLYKNYGEDFWRVKE